MDAELAKLVTLARGARGRIGAVEGAALRDDMGRTYSAATVTRGTLSLTAVELAVATAISSGAKGIEALVLCTDSQHLSESDVAAIRSLGGQDVSVTVISMRGDVVAEARS